MLTPFTTMLHTTSDAMKSLGEYQEESWAVRPLSPVQHLQ